MARDRRVQRVVDQRRFAGARDAGDARQQPDRNFQRDVLQIVAVRVAHLQPRRKRRRAVVRHLDLPPPGQILAGQRVRIVEHIVERALRDDFAAVHARAGPHVNDVVGGANRVLVVLDDDHGVAEVTQVLSACRSSGRYRVDADRSKARRARTSRPLDPSQSATPGVYVAIHRPIASRQSDRATDSRARR